MRKRKAFPVALTASLQPLAPIPRIRRHRWVDSQLKSCDGKNFRDQRLENTVPAG
jgi:hypothetical protein